MAIRNAQTEFRNVTIKFDENTGKDIVNEIAQIPSGIDAYKAAVVKVEEIEGEYARKGSFTDLVAAPVLVTGTNPNKIYVFDLTTTIATGVYKFVFVETRPNALNEA